MSEGRVVVGHPVDVGSGAVYTFSTDFQVPGTLGITWQRYYSTAATCSTWLGPKWSVPYFMSLQRHAERYTLIGAHGEEVFFDSPAGLLREGAILVDLAAKMELRREPERYTVLHWHTGGPSRRFCFQAKDGEPMPLATLENLAGQRIRVEYDAKRRPVLLVQELERRTIEITYERRDLISAIHFRGASAAELLVAYEYDHDARLVSAHDTLGHRKGYEYNRDGRMTAESNPLGSRFTFEYDGQGRCVRAAGADGYMERKLQYHRLPPITRVTDSRGAVTKYYLNPAGQVVQVANSLGGLTTNTFDEHGRLVEVTRADGSKERYQYDDQGNRCATVDPCGAKTIVAHNDQHLPVSMVDRNGTAWKLDNQ